VKISLSTPSTPLRDAFYVGLSVLLCFVASAYFIYNQASARNNIHNRQRLETIAWQTSALLNIPEHDRLATITPGTTDAKEYLALQKPVRDSKTSQAILSRVYTISFDGETPRMVVDSEGFPARTWERLPLQPGKSGDFSKETLYFCALSVLKTGKGWVGEIAYPGGDSFVVAMVPIFSTPGVPTAVMVVESTADRLQPTLASLRSAALSSVIIGAVVSLTVALAVYSYRRRNLVDANLLATVALTESALIEAIGEAIYRFNPQNESLTWQGNLRDLGWQTPGKVPTTRAGWIACIHPDDAPKCVAAWSGSAGMKWNVEYRVMGGDGRQSHLLDRGQHIAIDGRQNIAVGTILNITPLRETERRLRDVVDAAGEFIWEVDAQGNYTYLSERVVDVLGYPVEKLIGQHPLSLVPAEDLEVVREKMQAITSGRKNFRDFEHRMLHGSGKIIWVSINGVPIIGVAGQVTGFRGAGLDITDRKSAEKELIREKEAAQAADQAKSEFLAVMSHEIRTPLNSVLGFADLLTDTALSDAQKEQVGMIRRSGDALLTLLNDILDFSRIESGKMPIQPTAVEIRACLNEVADLYRATAHAKDVGILVDVDSDVPDALRTDPGRIRQILLNLIGNAVKFTPAGEVRVTAKRGAQEPGDGLFPILIEVADSGIGIPPDRIGRLFKPFSQADSSTTRQFGGTGLGLVICKRLAELLGGDVSLVRSSPSGTVFALELVLEIVEAPQTPATEPQDPTPELPADNRWRVLVVEDNPVNSMLALKMLASLGISAESCPDGLAAAEAHEKSPFDVIFMDLQMPVMDGLTSAARIRAYESAHPNFPKARIIALTADAMSGDRERCLAAGMDDYLSKPIRRPEMAEVIARANRALSAARNAA
jgi:PAS domain S-box-containing protein